MHTVSYVSLFHCFVASFRFVVSSLLFRLEQWSCRCPTWPTQGQRLQRQLLQNLLPCIVPPYERIREKEDRSRLIVWQKTVRPSVCTHCKGFFKPVFSYRLRQRPSTKGPPASSEFQLVSQGSRFREKKWPISFVMFVIFSHLPYLAVRNGNTLSYPFIPF